MKHAMAFHENRSGDFDLLRHERGHPDSLMSNMSTGEKLLIETEQSRLRLELEAKSKTIADLQQQESTRAQILSEMEEKEAEVASIRLNLEAMNETLRQHIDQLTTDNIDLESTIATLRDQQTKQPPIRAHNKKRKKRKKSKMHTIKSGRFSRNKVGKTGKRGQKHYNANEKSLIDSCSLYLDPSSHFHFTQLKTDQGVFIGPSALPSTALRQVARS